MKTKNIFVTFTFIIMVVSNAYAQRKVFDPLLDPNAIVMPLISTEEWNSTYLWYPGQLAAFYQKQCADISKERCVNVGYPGNFFAISHQAYFRKELRLNKETTIKWAAPSAVTLYINGIKQAVIDNQVTLQPGKISLMFEVNTTNNLPCIIFNDSSFGDFTTWQVSMDKTHWIIPETAPMYNKPSILPDAPRDIAVLIKPTEILPMRNAQLKDNKILIGKNGYVLIDFFHLEIGNVSFAVKGNGKLTAYVGESPEETLNEDKKTFEQIPIEPYVLSGNETVITLPEMALRYVKLFVEGDCEISDVKFTAKIWPVEFLMTFECDDMRMNDIWEASVATLHTSTHGFYLDGIKRDYLPWSMDAVLSTFGGDYIFGDKQTSLNGLSVALLPYNPQFSDIGIPDYPLHAIIGFKQNYKRYGDFNVILAYRDRIEQLLRFYETLQDEKGFIGRMGVWGFVPGWATRQGPDKKGTPAYAQIMLYLNYSIGAEFARRWGDRKFAKYCLNKAKVIKESIFKYFWNEEKGLFINGYKQNGDLDEGISHHAQYWAILADLFPKERYDNLFDILPQIPYYKSTVSYEKGYEFLAYSKARKVEQMWDFLFEVFGDWLRQGHTRFPENFSYTKSKNEQLVFYKRPFGLSLCHGANGVPGIVGVLNGIAGFSQSDRTPNHYTIQPDLIHLEWANIEFPVKEGKIKLKLTKDNMNTVEIPAGCQVDFISKDGKKTILRNEGVYNL